MEDHSLLGIDVFDEMDCGVYDALIFYFVALVGVSDSLTIILMMIWIMMIMHAKVLMKL